MEYDVLLDSAYDSSRKISCIFVKLETVNHKPVMIRKYNKADYFAILELLKLNTPGFFHPDEKADLVYYLNNHAENYFVLVSDNQILACGGYNYGEEQGIVKISWDIVHPQYQGKGFGSKLLKYRIDQVSQDKNVKNISVRTSQHAYRFYEHHGFNLIEIVKDYWAPGFDLYMMKFALVKSSSGKP